MRYMADSAALGRPLSSVCIIAPTTPTHFRLNTPQLDVNLAKFGNLERNNDISVIGELGVGNSIRNVYRSWKIYCIYVRFSVFLAFRYWPQNCVRIAIYVLYLEYSALNFKHRETLFTPKC
jgi:hypothetical protein